MLFEECIIKLGRFRFSSCLSLDLCRMAFVWLGEKSRKLFCRILVRCYFHQQKQIETKVGQYERNLNNLPRKLLNKHSALNVCGFKSAKYFIIQVFLSPIFHNLLLSKRFHFAKIQPIHSSGPSAIGNEKSEEILREAASQGSVLGPLLFTLNIIGSNLT